MGEPMIEVRDLTKHYGAVRALRGVSFQVPRGQVVGLLGPNGAGKTTAMRILTGFVAPTAGEARIDGLDVVEEGLACRRRIGYLPEGNPLYLELRVGEALGFAARMHGLAGTEARDAVGRSMEAVGLQGLARRTIGTFSKGFRQRVGLAQALLHEPDILILDEPTSGLDPNQQEDMRNLIRGLGEERTVILSTHILPEVEAVCDRALIINGGRLVADGSVAEIRRRAAGGPAARLTLRAAPEQAEAAFADLPFVRGVASETLLDEPGVLRVRVATEDAPGRPELEALAARAVERGLGLSGLEVEVATLEQIFAELTATGEPPPGAEGLADDGAGAGEGAAVAAGEEEEV